MFSAGGAAVDSPDPALLGMVGSLPGWLGGASVVGASLVSPGGGAGCWMLLGCPLGLLAGMLAAIA